MGAVELFKRRRQRHKWLFVVAAVPLALFALIGLAYGAFLPYAALAAVCIAQLFYPTWLGWGVVLATAIFALAEYGSTAVSDIIAINSGGRPSMFLNEIDTFAFASLIVLIAVVVVGLLLNRPTPLPQAIADA